jgi:hypothetical protein
MDEMATIKTKNTEVVAIVSPTFLTTDETYRYPNDLKPDSFHNSYIKYGKVIFHILRQH